MWPAIVWTLIGFVIGGISVWIIITVDKLVSDVSTNLHDIQQTVQTMDKNIKKVSTTTEEYSTIVETQLSSALISLEEIKKELEKKSATSESITGDLVVPLDNRSV